MAPVVLHADAELVAITWLRPRLPMVEVCSERPLPDELVGALPVVEVVRMPSPPSHRWVHDIARMEVIVLAPASAGRSGAIDLAGLVAAEFAAMSGAVVAVPAGEYTPSGTVAVTQVARQTPPSDYPEPNDSIRAMSFTSELYLRPLRVA